MQRVLAGQAQDVHGTAVGQGAARQQPGRRRCFLRGQELVAHVLLFQGQYVREPSLGGEVGHGGGWCGLPERQAGTGRAQARLPWQVQLVAGEAGLALQQGRGRGLQNEFGALNALVLVTHVTLRLCGPVRGHPVGGCSWLWCVRLDVPSSVN